MGLNDFVLKDARPLPVFVLVDASGSMNGTKMEIVNNSLREMVSSLSNLEGAKGQIELCIIKISQNVEVIQPLTKVEEIVLPILKASGRTPIGNSLEKVIELIEDPTIVPKRAYTPAIILISDGIPTDITYEMVGKRPLSKQDYLEWDPVYNFHKREHTKNCMKMALGIGEDADYELLKAFLNNPSHPVIKSSEISTIPKFFEWVTRSMSQRSKSANPNDIDEIPFQDLFPDEELVF